MNRKIHILGIVNLTDDSYYAPSRVQGADALLQRVGTMLREGADWIDLGACSTRPGSQPVGADEEWRRLEPALQAIRQAFPEARISRQRVHSSQVRVPPIALLRSKSETNSAEPMAVVSSLKERPPASKARRAAAEFEAKTKAKRQKITNQTLRIINLNYTKTRSGKRSFPQA